MKLNLLGILVLVFCFSAPLWADKKPEGTMISVGKNLTYKRGTARAKEEFLEFPYYHASAGNTAFWASVVHLENGGLRLIVKADECQGKKDKSGQLANQDFAKDDPFQKTLDLIKEDAFNNRYKELLAQKPMKKDGWTVLADGSAVNSIFYQNSKGRWFCFLGVLEPNKETISGPIVVSFQRTRDGALVSTMTPGSQSWSPPQPLDPVRQAAAVRALDFLESRNGF